MKTNSSDGIVSLFEINVGKVTTVTLIKAGVAGQSQVIADYALSHTGEL